MSYSSLASAAQFNYAFVAGEQNAASASHQFICGKYNAE